MDRQIYETPSVEVIEVAHAGVICASETGTEGSPNFNSFNNEEVW
jgi:hypothetical protein